MLLILYILSVFVGSTLVNGQGLSATGVVKCGVKNCTPEQYCSEYGSICESCALVCDPKLHNFDQNRCEKSCQEYLHDVKYVKQSGGATGNDLKGQVDKLSRLVTVSLTFTCLMLLVLAIFLSFQFYRWKEKKNLTFATIKQKFFGKKVTEETPGSNVPDPGARKGELRLDMTSNMSQSEHSPVTVTTSISRRPAEDSTLDYAYDNPALSPSR